MEIVDSKIMKRIFFIFMLIFVCAVASAQTVTDVDCYQDGKTIVITYKLQGSKDANVSFSYSINGGKTYNKIKSITGSVGKQSPGNYKSARWNVLSDVDRLVEDNVTFKVDATAVYTSSTSSYSSGSSYKSSGSSYKSSGTSSSYKSSSTSSSSSSSSRSSSSSSAGQADYEKGYKYEQQKNYSSAMTYYRKAAEKGHKEAKKRMEALQLYFW